MSTRYFSKDNTRIQYPLEGLDMRPYLVQASPNLQTLYDLYAVINHSGGLSSGHYTAFAKSPHKGGTWVHYDDEHLSVLKENEIVSAQAYVLFYRKREGPGGSPPDRKSVV